jgi:hypothetical protein
MAIVEWIRTKLDQAKWKHEAAAFLAESHDLAIREISLHSRSKIARDSNHTKSRERGRVIPWPKSISHVQQESAGNDRSDSILA